MTIGKKGIVRRESFFAHSFLLQPFFFSVSLEVAKRFMAPMMVFLHTFLRKEEEEKRGVRNPRADLWPECSLPFRRFVSGMTEPSSHALHSLSFLRNVSQVMHKL
jgi:hypothetical protein